MTNCGPLAESRVYGHWYSQVRGGCWRVCPCKCPMAPRRIWLAAERCFFSLTFLSLWPDCCRPKSAGTYWTSRSRIGGSSRPRSRGRLQMMSFPPSHAKTHYRTPQSTLGAVPARERFSDLNRGWVDSDDWRCAEQHPSGQVVIFLICANGW